MSRNLVAEVNEAVRAACLGLADDVPGGATREFGPIAVASTGLSLRIYNQIFVFDTPSRDDFVTAVDWIEAREVPYWATATDSTVETVGRLADDLGLTKAGEQPGMAMTPLGAVPPAESSAAISEVGDQDGFDAFLAVVTSVFGTSREVATRVYRPALTADGDHLFVARVDGQPAACGLLIPSGDVAGLYAIGVVEQFRRQGIGEAMSRELLRAGRDAGCQVGVLQSSEMGKPLYETIGFETVVTHHHFESTA
jgi:GNAT superfamily N-acetyltransferase